MPQMPMYAANPSADYQSLVGYNTVPQSSQATTAYPGNSESELNVNVALALCGPHGDYPGNSTWYKR